MQLFLDICDWVAYFTGVIGAPLGFIEYFKPHVADKIEVAIDKFGDKVRAIADNLGRNNYLNEIIWTVSTIVFMITLYYFISKLSPIGTRYGISPKFLLLNILAIPVYLRLTLYAIEGSIIYLNKFTNGHALGTIGLILIIVGVIGDSADKLLSFILGY
jgi:hypothetical protein